MPDSEQPPDAKQEPECLGTDRDGGAEDRAKVPRAAGRMFTIGGKDFTGTDADQIEALLRK